MKIKAILLIFGATLAVTVGDENKKIVCYWRSWSVYGQGDGAFDLSYVDPKLCTHMIYTFIGLSPNGEVKIVDPWIDLPDSSGKDNYNRFNKLRKQNPTLKTMIAIGGWDEGSGKYSKVVADPSLRRTMVESIVAFVIKYNFDGLDLNWRYPVQGGLDNGGRPVDKQNFVLLLKELRERFDQEGLLLSAAVGAAKRTARKSYNISEISKYLHFINLMTYNLHDSWSGKTGIDAPLYAASSETDDDKKENVDAIIKYWLSKGAPAEKLVLGVPFYGWSYTLSNSQVNDVGATVWIRDVGPYTNKAGLLGYDEICLKIKNDNWQIKYDEERKAVYAYGGNQWVSFENEITLKEKTDYINAYNLGGVMVWSIDTDDFHGNCGPKWPLLNVLYKELASKRSLSPNQSSIPKEKAITEPLHQETHEPQKPRQPEHPVGPEDSEIHRESSESHDSKEPQQSQKEITEPLHQSQEPQQTQESPEYDKTQESQEQHKPEKPQKPQASPDTQLPQHPQEPYEPQKPQKPGYPLKPEVSEVHHESSEFHNSKEPQQSQEEIPTSSGKLCRAKGYVRDPQDCSKFYYCRLSLVHYRYVYEARPLKCPAPLLYDTSLSKCNWPNKVECNTDFSPNPNQPWSTTEEAVTEPTHQPQHPQPPQEHQQPIQPHQSQPPPEPHKPQAPQQPEHPVQPEVSEVHHESSESHDSRKPQQSQKKIFTSSGKLCQAEGYVRDPQDCSKFYYCRLSLIHFRYVYEALPFNCPAPLVYDTSLFVCNWPNKVQCDFSISLSPWNTKKGVITEPSQQPQRPQLQKSQHPIPPQQPKAPQKPKQPTYRQLCQAEGYVRDPQNCSKFYYCRFFNNVYGAQPFNCPAPLVYDTSLGVCNWPVNVQC